MNNKVFLYTGNKNNDEDTASLIRESFNDHGYTFTRDPDDADLIVCIGGDGSFLRLVQSCSFPASPILGINTGHLGFFQELDPSEIDSFMDELDGVDYKTQNIYPIEAYIYLDDRTEKITGLNEVLIRGPHTHITHLDVFIETTKIQRFSGDGLLFSTPVGSTAYNYSLGGSIVSPDLSALQMTPIAPSNTNAYRSFPTSIMYSDEKKATIIPMGRTKADTILIYYDGLSAAYENVSKIELVKSNQPIHVIRFKNYDYWQKLTSKLL